MEKVTLELLAHRVVSDPTFRRLFLANPRVAITEAGWDVPADDVDALQTWHASLRDVTTLEELERALAAFVASRRPSAA